jgi:hypothetical protein
MMTCVPAVAFSHGGRRALILGLVLLAGRAARADEPGAPVANGAAAPLVAKAEKALGGKRWREAKRGAEEALKLEAADVDASAVLGLADKGLGDCKGARAPLAAAFAGKSAVPGVAAALAACLGDKTEDKQTLAEARLAAAREAAGAGRAADARGLYEGALGAALLTLPVGSPPEEPAADEGVAPVAAPAPGEDTAAAEAAAAERARVAAEAAEAAKQQQVARDEEARRAAAAPPPAPVVIAPAAPLVVARPASRAPLAFSAGLRSTGAAKDSGGGKHVDAGVMFTWLTFARSWSRVALVVDLESTRWRSAREDATSRGATALYGLGVDWSVPLSLGALSLVGGAELLGGVLQSSADNSPLVNDGLSLQLMPHVGAQVMFREVGVFLDGGWRFQLAESSSVGQASEGGAVVQGGLRFEMEEGAPAPRGYDVGYTVRFYAPNGSNVYARYGGLPATNSTGPLLGHEATLTTNEGLPTGAEHGVALTYIGSDRASGPSLTVIELGYLLTWHAFKTRQILNPYLGAQVGVAYIKSDDATTFSSASLFGAVGVLRAGLDVAVARRVRLRAGFAYDAVADSNDVSNSSLSGYSVEAGAIIRL